MPLLEIVTEPDMNSPREAYDYLVKLKCILEYLEVSDCDMEKGSLRCDANISIRPEGRKGLGTKVELKNMNTFKGVRLAIDYEVKRQVSLAEDREKITQETRLWDADRQVTVPMRAKEEAEDYRYFPEPDLVPFIVDKSAIEKIKDGLPELPEARSARFAKEFGLSEYDAGVITSQREIADYFERCAGIYHNKKNIANWIMGDIMSGLNLKNISIGELKVTPEGLVGLLNMIDSGKISGKMAKDVLVESIESGILPEEIVDKRGLSQISDASRIEETVKAVLAREEKTVKDYKLGKKSAFTFLVGQVMKETKGKANPAMVNELLKKNLGE